jgi:hypothetical protein
MEVIWEGKIRFVEGKIRLVKIKDGTIHGATGRLSFDGVDDSAELNTTEEGGKD